MGMGLDELEFKKPSEGQRGLSVLLEEERQKNKLLGMRLELKESQLNGVLRGLEAPRGPAR